MMLDGKPQVPLNVEDDLKGNWRHTRNGPAQWLHWRESSLHKWTESSVFTR